MLKKIPLLTIISLLASCGVLPDSPKYKLSDDDAKSLIIEMNKFEQCVFPDKYQVYRSQAKKPPLSTEEDILWKSYFINALSKIIGQKSMALMQSDSLSQKYVLEQVNKFNHDDPASFDKKWCENLKKEYKKGFAILKTEIRRQKEAAAKMQEQAIREQKELVEQEERERKARQAYYASPEGQRDLARQQYQQQLMAQQRVYEERLREQRQAYEWQQMNNMINGAINNIANTMQQNANFINSMTNSMPRYQYQPPQKSSITCYSLPGGITQCK
ncbi:DUF5358 family protein [Avibacterium paragallinarum]|uniref:DUF5358 family protein n=1 Tax=Avibacterium paragallinarum TaxID=728 RepID=UPI003985D791